MKRLIGGSGGANAAGGQAGNTQVQFNDNGAFGGDADFTYNKTTNQVTLGGDINLNDGGSFTTTLQVVTPTANRTISFPDATGTVGLVAGSSGQLVYNNAGAYAGVSTMTFDGTSVTLAGRLINSYTSASLAPAKIFTGTWFTGGGTTNTKPHFLIEPTGTTSNNWSNAGTALGVNAPSTFTGRLIDCQVNGSMLFSVENAAGSSNTRIFTNFLTVGGTVSQTSGTWGLNSGGVSLNNAAQLNFSSTGSANTSIDTGLTRSAAGVVKVTNGSTGDGTISGQLRAVGAAPATTGATGAAGDIRYDANYIYICTATNTWKRAAIATW
jgi:hypothetical protein